MGASAPFFITEDMTLVTYHMTALSFIMNMETPCEVGE